MCHLEEVVRGRDVVREESKHFRNMFNRSEMSARLPMTETQTSSQQKKASQANNDDQRSTNSCNPPNLRSICGKLRDVLTKGTVLGGTAKCYVKNTKMKKKRTVNQVHPQPSREIRSRVKRYQRSVLRIDACRKCCTY